jgi:iron(III) transport system substrate-binding protein
MRALSGRYLSAILRTSLFFGALALILGGPFLLHRGNPVALVKPDRRLVILSPHDPQIRSEIGGAFIRKWKAETGETLDIDWRIPGGSSEIFMLLKSEYLGAFRQYYEGLGLTWSAEVASAFASRPAEKLAGNASDARAKFLASEVGIGIDLLFGGGSSDFQQLAESGYLVSGSAESGTGLRAVRKLHPDWFGERTIPESYGGERYRDSEDRWVGVLLASFGIIYNTDLYDALKGLSSPKEWPDLADPRLEGYLALADPTKSGSAAKAYELIVQQQMLEAYQHHLAEGATNAEDLAIEEGWLRGLVLIQRLAGNARYFTDSAGKIGLGVVRGDAAAGMAIDSYARVLRDYVRRADGTSRVSYVLPAHGTSLSVDPVAMLRGAPNPDVATAFMTFLLSSEGQRLWALKPGVAGGPVASALRRFPIRRDVYADTNQNEFSEADVNPYQRVTGFVYHPEWTQSLFPALRFMIRVACIDSHEELRSAWQALIRSGMNEDALKTFHDWSGASLDDVRKRIIPVLRQRDKVGEMALARELGQQFRERYHRAEALARNRGAP